MKIAHMLDILGVDRKLKGYGFCVNAIALLIRYDCNVMIESIYEGVSLSLFVSEANVERNIRYAIEKTWEKGNIDVINDVFGLTVRSEKGKPTNKEFLFLIADKLKNN